MQRIVGLIYAIPLALIVFALVLRSQGLITPRSSYATQPVKPTLITPRLFTPTPPKKTSQLQKNIQSILSFDLEKSQTCRVPAQMGNIQIDTSGGMAHVDYQDTSTHRVYVYKQDCVYSWSPLEKKGAKTCGIGKLLGMLQLVGSISSSSTEELLGSLLKSSGISLGKVFGGELDLMRYCHANPVDVHQFDLPSAVTFLEENTGKN